MYLAQTQLSITMRELGDFCSCPSSSLSVGYHGVETRVRMKLMGLGRAKEVKRLDDAQAVELGAEMLGEIIIFSVGAGVIAAEYMRQVRNDARKESKQNDRLGILEGRLQELGLALEQQNAEMRELNRTLADMHGKKLPKKIFDSQSGLSVTVESS